MDVSKRFELQELYFLFKCFKIPSESKYYNKVNIIFRFRDNYINN